MSVSCRSLLPLLAVALLCGLLLPAESHALYRYRDAAGNLCFTDDWRTIPVELRASAEPPVPAPGSAPSPAKPAAVAPVEPASAVTAAPVPSNLPLPAATQALATAQGLWEHPWAKIGAYLAGVVVLFLLLIKLLDYLPSPLLARLILLAFFLGVMTFGYKLYIENMVQGFDKVKDQSVKVLEKSLQRVDRADPGQVPPGQ